MDGTNTKETLLPSLARELKSGEIIENILDFARKMMDSEAAALFLYDDSEEKYTGHFDFGKEKKTVVREKADAGERDIFYFITENSRPLVINPSKGGGDEDRFSCMMEEFGYATDSVICVPMISRRRLSGVLIAMNKKKGVFSGKDVDLFSTFANQAAVMLDSGRSEQRERDIQRIDRELSMAKLVQDSFLPRLKDAKWGYCQIGVQKKAAAFNVSGDFYDLFPVEGNDYFFLFGDVSGKGIPAALMMANLLSRIRYLVFRYQKLTRIVFEMNNEVRRLSKRGMFVTMNCGILDLNRKKATYVNCGHCPLISFDAEEQSWKVLEKSHNIPLGIMENFEFRPESIPFGTGDMILLVSDGVIEAKNASGEEFSMNRLRNSLPDGSDFTAQSLVDRVYDSLKEHSVDEKFADDVTIFAIGNSLIRTQIMKLDFSMHQLDKKNEFLRAFLNSFKIEQETVNGIMRCINRMFLAAIARTERQGIKEPLEVKLVSKLDSFEIGFRTFDSTLDLADLADEDCKTGLKSLVDEMRFSKIQGGSHLLLVKRIV